MTEAPRPGAGRRWPEPARRPDPVVRASWAGTAVLAVASAVAVAAGSARPVAVAAALALNLAGVLVFFWAYAIAVNRSRTDAIGIGGLFFLAGEVAPAGVRRSLRWALAAQVGVAVAAAAARPYTAVAFGILAPLFGLSLMGLWGARHGHFEARGPA
ncbi:MAG TPA: hypothetical protein VFO65_11450, partial [Acidimicrobiales bacterium]|nr:hypothetical protein [Acidimicrobiales bacterium]